MQQIIWKSGFILGWCNLYAVVLGDCEIFFDGDFSIIRCVGFVTELSIEKISLVLSCSLSSYLEAFPFDFNFKPLPSILIIKQYFKPSNYPIVKPLPSIKTTFEICAHFCSDSGKDSKWSKFLLLFFWFSSKHQTRYQGYVLLWLNFCLAQAQSICASLVFVQMTVPGHLGWSGCLSVSLQWQRPSLRRISWNQTKHLRILVKARLTDPEQPISQTT